MLGLKQKWKRRVNTKGLDFISIPARTESLAFISNMQVLAGFSLQIKFMVCFLNERPESKRTQIESSFFVEIIKVSQVAEQASRVIGS